MTVFCSAGLDIPAPATSMSRSRAHKPTVGPHLVEFQGVGYPLPALGSAQIQHHGKSFSEPSLPSQAPGFHRCAVTNPGQGSLPSRFPSMEVWEKGPAPCWGWAGRKEILRLIGAAEEGKEQQNGKMPLSPSCDNLLMRMNYGLLIWLPRLFLNFTL